MSIRSAAKAIIVKDGKILLNKCHDGKTGHYYALPGGGQHPYETLHDTLYRECLEETGYKVRPVKFAALCEEIHMDPDIRREDPDYAHKVYHVFICELTDENIDIPTERDSNQLSSEWIKMSELDNIRLLPAAIGENILDIINGTARTFLGSRRITFG